jgi:hypothetical protein
MDRIKSVNFTEMDKRETQRAESIQLRTKTMLNKGKLIYHLKDNHLFLPCYGQEALQTVADNSTYFIAYYGFIWYNTGLSF